jgi:hypothetical protein
MQTIRTLEKTGKDGTLVLRIPLANPGAEYEVLVVVQPAEGAATAANAARLKLFALAYNLANFLRQLVLPKLIRGWTLTTLREKLIKIGAKVVSHSKYVIFQLAEVAVPRQLLAAILERIARLRLVCASG